MTNTVVGIGTKFHADYQDGRPEFEVISKSGRGVWKCQARDREFSGLIKHFSTGEIQQALNFERAFDDARNGKDAFYESLDLGSIVHYHNSFGEFVRCEVVMGTTVHSKDREVRCLKPIALVGNWKPYDLPRRERDGSIHLGHHAKSIVEGECFRPSPGCIYESPSFTDGTRHGNPAKMKPLSLEVPPMDEAAERKARLEQVRQSVRSLLDEFPDDPSRALQAAQNLLASVTL